MNEKINVRKIEEKDLQKIADIFKTEYGKEPYKEKWTKEIVLKKLEDYCKKSNLLVAEVNNKTVGFAIFRDEIWDNGNHVFIEEIVVSSEFQGRGIGKNLLNFIEDYCKKRNFISIDLWAFKDARAFEFYKRNNFKEHEKGVLMSKKIK